MAEQAELLTVQHLIEAFQPRIVAAGGAAGLSKPIEGVSVGEEEDPIRWMPARSLLLTAGTMVRSDPLQGHLLIENLADAGMAGVGVAMAPYWTDVPDSMIEAANRCSLPLLRISGGIAFHEIVTHIMGALSSRHTYLLQRIVSVQALLTGLLIKDRRPQAVTDCLADQFDAEVLFLDWRGRLLSESGSRIEGQGTSPTKEQLWQLYSSEPDLPSQRLSDGREALFCQVRIERAVEGVAVIVLPKGRSKDVFVSRTLSFACTLLEAEALMGSSLRAGQSHARAGLLVDLLKRRGDGAGLSERMAHYGILGSEPWRLIALTSPAEIGQRRDSKTVRRLANEGVGMADAYLESLDARFLSAWYQGCLCILLALREEDQQVTVREIAHSLLKQASSELKAEGLRAGVSGPFAGATAAGDALRQAREALLMRGRLRQTDPAVILHEELALHIALLDSLPDEHLRRLHATIVQPLLDADGRTGGQLYDTLLTYLDHDRSLEQTAQALYLHRNSLARRLQHIERLVGLDLHSTDDLVDVRLAVHGETVLQLRSGE